MPDEKQRRLDSTLAAVQLRHGPQALHRGEDTISSPDIPHIATGFAALDAMTGCQGFPLGALTLLSGRTTSGKLTIACKVLANAQRDLYGNIAHSVVLLDLAHTIDPDYLRRCGVDLDALLVGRPQPGPDAICLLGDVLAMPQVRAVVLDSLTDLAVDRSSLYDLNVALGKLLHLLRTNHIALLVLDEPQPPWLRWFNLDSSSRVRRAAALHIEMQRENWLLQNGVEVGYRAQARLLKSRWVYHLRSAPVEIVFNGSVHARETW